MAFRYNNPKSMSLMESIFTKLLTFFKIKDLRKEKESYFKLYTFFNS